MLRVLSAIFLLLNALSPASGGAQRTPGDEGGAATWRQDAYVWQRAWTEPVSNAVVTLAPHFGELIALQAEVSWVQGTPRCTKVKLDYPALRASARPVGLALRIGNFPGPFNADDPCTGYLATLAESLIAEAAAQQLQPLELQLDFDCAESKLEGYRVWLEAIQQAVHPLPVTITALPAWLQQPAFKELVQAADGYVLQVHSFERPRSPETALTLCDPQAARRAVARAAGLGRPFRVALPTYGYLAAFDAQGEFLGLSAEGPARPWPDTAQVVEVRADPGELSTLIRDWNRARPPELTGVIWYRLPVTGDVLNWPWPTLASVMNGQAPVVRLCGQARPVKPGLVEIDLVNEGTADAEHLTNVKVRWAKQRRIASDALHGYQWVENSPDTLTFQTTRTNERLPAGARRVIGWIRFDGDPEVEVELDEWSN